MRRLSTSLAAAFILAALASVSTAADPRVAHTATLLPSGDILFAGGVKEDGTTLASADIFAASTGGGIVATGAMAVARASHTATLMTNGCVLVAGGNTASDAAAPVPTATARIYNPATGVWSSPGSLTTARFNHTATLLNDGRVLICGGRDAAGNAIGPCEFYTPTECTTGGFTAAPSLLQARYNHTAVLLKDGKVWFAGGVNPAIAATGGYLVTTERYDPGGNAFQSASPLIEARAGHTTTLMGDGKALVVGGNNGRDVLANKGITESAEIYDPTSNSVTPAAAMSARRQAHASALSADGKVTVFGGLGNITTTYIEGTGLGPNVFGANSTVVTNAGAIDATSTGLIDLDFKLNKDVTGKIGDGEIWLSSPSVMPSWGAVRFTPASQTDPNSGLRINLAGVKVEEGTIELTQAALSQMQGDVVYYPRTDVANTASANTSGSATFTPSPLNTTDSSGDLTVGNVTANITIPMDKAFIGRKILSGALTLTAGTISRTGVFTATLTGAGAGTINVLPSAAVVADADGNGEVTINVTFGSLAGTISYEGSGSLASPTALAASDDVSLTMRMTYTMDGADLTGETFIVGGSTIVIRKMAFADTETYDPKSNSWILNLTAGVGYLDHRYGHTATLLPNNDTVFYGGRACSGATCAAQVATSRRLIQFLNSEDNFAATAGAASQKRAFHTSTLLPGGDILVAGGTNGPSILRHAELFTPGTDAFSPVNGEMLYVRDLHTATLLPNGRVLIAGGFTTNATSTGSTNTTEIYYPDTKRFVETSPMISSRSNHSAIMLPDGRVFVAGGFGAGDVITGTSEIYISTQSRWLAAETMPAGCQRAVHATVQLKDGRIMLIGGVNASGVLDTSAIYDPALNSWGANCTTVPAMPSPLRSHTATLLPDGYVLVAGGNDGLGEADASYVYDPSLNTWAETNAAPLTAPRFNHTATLLPNGTVMISGGSQRFGDVPKAIEVFHVNASSWVPGGVVVEFAGGARAFHTMTLALNNKIYAIGGSDGVIGGVGSSLYTSAEAGYFTATPDNFSKDAPPSFRQSTITATNLAAVPTTVFLPNDSMTVVGNKFRGGTEASGGGAASANSSFSFPHMVLSQVDGSGGAASQSNGGFTVDLTPKIFLNAANQATLDTSLTVALPATSAALPYGWYALRMGANGVYSDATMIQVGPAKPVAAPGTIAGAVQGASSITWTWSAVAGVDGYNVYNAATGVFLTTIPASGSPRYNQTALGPGTQSSILVAGYTLSGDGPSSASPAYATPDTSVSQPVASALTTTSIEWGWTDPGSVINYRVYNATNGVLLGTPVLNSFTEVGLGTNTLHSIVVTAVTTTGEGPLSPSASAYTAAASPGLFTPAATPTTGSILVNWTANGNPLQTRYRFNLFDLANADSEDGSETLVFTTTTTDLNLTVGALTPSTLYRYEVVGLNEDDVDSAVVTGSTWTLPTAPIPLTLLGTTATSISVGWSANNNSSSATYQVTYSRDNFALDIATAIAFGANYGGTDATIADLVTSATYSVRVIASNPFGQLSQFSNSITTRTFNGGAPEGSIRGSLLAAGDSSLYGMLGNGRQVLLRAPAHTFPSDVAVTVSSFLPTGTLCPNATNIAFSIVDSPALQPAGSLYFTFSFTPAELGTIPAGRALLLRYDPDSGTCVPLETVVDSASRKMTARINHFSLFQVGQVPLATTADSTRVFPNPYYTGRDGYATIDSVPPGARVRIFTLRGEQVLDVKANSTGLLTWSGTNGSGRAVASGVYLVMVESGGSKKILKLAVIR